MIIIMIMMRKVIMGRREKEGSIKIIMGLGIEIKIIIQI